MKENFVYPARVKEENGLLQLKFLDFPEITLIEEETMDELIRSAQDSLALTILDYESRNVELSNDTPSLETRQTGCDLYSYLASIFQKCNKRNICKKECHNSTVA